MRLLALTAVLAAALTACDSGRDGPGSFEAAITGAEAAVLSGTASFDESREVVLGDGLGGRVIFRQIGRPEPGRYTLADWPDDPIRGGPSPGDTIKAVLVFDPTGYPRAYAATSGTFDVVRATAEEVSGSFSFEAVGVQDSTRAVRVEGEFRAEFVPFCC